MAKRRRPTKRRPFPETPTCNCALLCDDVMVSAGKAKHTLSGIIGMILVRELPTILGGYVMYVRLSNVYPDQTVTISLEDADTGTPVFEGRADLPNRADPLGVYTLMEPVPAFKVEAPGRYMFTARAGQEILAQSPIMIRVVGSGADANER